MNIQDFRCGYDECRQVMVGSLKKILSVGDDRLRHDLAVYIDDLEEAAKADHWQSVQEEFPGITREEYEAELDQFAETFKRRMKLRLVK